MVHFDLLQWLLILNLVIFISLFGIQTMQRKKADNLALITRTRNPAESALTNELFRETLDHLRRDAEQGNLLGSFDDNTINKVMVTSPLDMLETLIEYYRRETLKDHILFTTQIEGILTDRLIQEFHMIHLVGNLLQNALEALQSKGIKGSRLMELKINCQDNELTIMVFNTYPEMIDERIDLNQWTKSGYSTKGKEGRGHGLALVQKLVNEKDGILSLDLEKGILLIIEFAV